MKLPSGITSKFGKQILQLKASSPQLMFVGGAVAGAAGVVMACKSTLKLSETLEGFEELKEKSKYALENKVVDNEGVLYDEKAFAKDQAVIRIKTILAVSKLYAPAAGLLLLSASLMTGSHVTLTRRNAAAAAAYASVDEAFNKYRERVRNQLGKDVDDEMRYGSKQISETVEDAETGKKKVVKHTVVGDGAPSMYAKFFDEYSPRWVKDPEYNRIFLRSQQGYFNQMLQTQGFVFLNDVYEALGIEKTKAGQIVGWCLSKDGDNFVDFGIFDNVSNDRVRDFVNGREYSILLDFNVDGIILDTLKKSDMNQSIKMAGAAVVGAGVGFFVGYKLLEKRLAEAFDERLSEETSKMREFYSIVEKPFASPQDAVKELIPDPPAEAEDPRQPNMKVAYHKIVKSEYTEAQADEVEAAAAVEEIVNVFDNAPRDSSKPYVIAEDVYMSNETGFEQSTLTYYEADDTLVDDRDEIIASPNDVIGEKFRVQFGEDSRDKNTVYFRHEKLGLEFEVVRSEGSYKREVLGEETG